MQPSSMSWLVSRRPKPSSLSRSAIFSTTSERPTFSMATLSRQYQPQSSCVNTKVHSLDGFGCADLPAAVGAAGALLHYLTRQMRRNASHLRAIQPYRSSEFVILDATTQNHLELVQSRAGKSMTLLVCSTAPSRQWGHAFFGIGCCIRFGMCEIRMRQDAIACLLGDPLLLGTLREHLSEIRIWNEPWRG